MLEANVERLLSELTPTELVLDVGGWACPFNRAQWVLDAEPFETRGYYKTFGGRPFQGPPEEWFGKATWVQRDICDRTPWPFSDEFFDVAVCSHTLEDIRDPLWVCSELVRVAKRGYIEVPSRAYESTFGVERPGQAGLSHHRWLIDIEGNRVRFLPKYHMIHTDWRFHLPASYKARLTAEASVQWLWWRDGFDFDEVTIHGLAAQEGELMRFASTVLPRAAWRYRVDFFGKRASSLSRRAVNWGLRKVHG